MLYNIPRTVHTPEGTLVLLLHLLDGADDSLAILLGREILPLRRQRRRHETPEHLARQERDDYGADQVHTSSRAAL